LTDFLGLLISEFTIAAIELYNPPFLNILLDVLAARNSQVMKSYSSKSQLFAFVCNMQIYIFNIQTCRIY
jgi:hypothetical protein